MGDELLEVLREDSYKQANALLGHGGLDGVKKGERPVWLQKRVGADRSRPGK